MTGNESANHQDPTPYCVHLGGRECPLADQAGVAE